MSALKVSKPRKASKAAEVASEVPAAQAAPAGDLVAQSAAVWAALDYLAGKNGRRDDLPAGGIFSVKLEVAAKVDDGPIYRQSFQGPLTVGHDSEVAPSHTPGGDKMLIAVALSKLNAATREAVIREALADYSAGELPEAPESIVAEVEAMQKQIRGLFRQNRRGSVKFDGKAAQPSLGLIY